MKHSLHLTVFTLLLGFSRLPAATLYVSPESTNSAPPYATWVTAATDIQRAVDAAAAGDTVVVTNGVYSAGGRAVYGTMTNRVVVDKPLALTSVNGPEVTVIQGYQVPGMTNGDGAIRCLYLANGAVLSGFTLTHGATRSSGDEVREQSGGGFWSESSEAHVTNCILAGNSASYEGGGASGGTLDDCTLTANVAHTGGGTSGGVLSNCTLTANSAYEGGGASWCDLYNCTLTANVATNGGGEFWGALYNCTLTGNSATDAGGGAYGGSLNNCIVYSNTAGVGTNYSEGILQYSCTSPMPTDGFGNITNEPAFINAMAGDLHLQPNSPCINAGLNAYVRNTTDFDGNPRIAGATVDIGAYEFEGHGSVISYAWLQQYGLPTDGSADFADPDDDGMNNWQEWICGTCPTNSLSALRMLSVAPAGPNATVTWQSVTGVSYFLERTANLALPFAPLASYIIGQAGTSTYTDTNAAGAAPLFYRVGVRGQ